MCLFVKRRGQKKEENESTNWRGKCKDENSIKISSYIQHLSLSMNL